TAGLLLIAACRLLPAFSRKGRRTPDVVSVAELYSAANRCNRRATKLRTADCRPQVAGSDQPAAGSLPLILKLAAVSGAAVSPKRVVQSSEFPPLERPNRLLQSAPLIGLLGDGEQFLVRIDREVDR